MLHSKGDHAIMKAKSTPGLLISFILLLSILTVFTLSGCSASLQESTDKTSDAEPLTEVTTEASTAESSTEATPTIESPTENPTTPPTEAPKSREDILENGIWVKYSPQASIFEAYQFSDGIIERKEYIFENGTVEEFNTDHTHAFMTYTLNENSLTIRDDDAREWTWDFTDDDNIMEHRYEDTMGGETYSVVQQIYRYDSLPGYDTAASNRKGNN